MMVVMECQAFRAEMGRENLLALQEDQFKFPALKDLPVIPVIPIFPILAVLPVRIHDHLSGDRG